MTEDLLAQSQTLSIGAALSALGTLRHLAEGEVTAVMLVLQRGKQPAEVSQLVPTNAAQPILTNVVREAASELADCEVIDYEPATSTADSQVMWVPVSSVPLLESIVGESEDLAGMPLFDPSHATLANLQLAAMRAEMGDTAAIFIQSLRGNQVVARSRLGVIVRRGVIDVPRRGQLLLFSKAVSAVVVDDVVLFRDRSSFQKLFGYLEELRQQASATFAAITAGLLISGVEEMAAAVTGSPAMLGKMASIQRKLDRYPEYRPALTMPHIVKFVREHPECQVDLIGDGDDAQLVFRNDVQHRFKILKLLDDDYLRSELTTLEYDANSKSAPIDNR